MQWPCQISGDIPRGLFFSRLLRPIKLVGRGGIPQPPPLAYHPRIFTLDSLLSLLNTFASESGGGNQHQLLDLKSLEP